jgi:hypothetical protein
LSRKENAAVFSQILQPGQTPCPESLTKQLSAPDAVYTEHISRVFTSFISGDVPPGTSPQQLGRTCRKCAWADCFLLCAPRYSNLVYIARGAYGMVCVADDSVRSIAS